LRPEGETETVSGPLAATAATERNDIRYGSHRAAWAIYVDPKEFQTFVADGPGFIRITVAGPYSWARLDRLLRRIAAESATRAISRVLLDATAVPVKLSTIDKYTMGVMVALRLGGSVKVALLGSPVTIDGFGETVARNRGANVGVFTDQAAAIRWLVGPETLQPPL